MPPAVELFTCTPGSSAVITGTGSLLLYIYVISPSSCVCVEVESWEIDYMTIISYVLPMVVCFFVLCVFATFPLYLILMDPSLLLFIKFVAIFG